MSIRAAMVGSGIIAQAWAISFARGGCHVALYDPEPGAVDSALHRIEATLQDLETAGLTKDQSGDEIFRRLSPASSLEEVVAGADWVQENAPERLEVKKEIFSRLDAIAAPAAILASSSSGIVASTFTEELEHRERCLIVHPTNPPYVVPIVEVVPAPWTSQEVLERAMSFLRDIGQTPIHLKVEVPGFVMNRIQAAVLHECYRIVANGWASPRDVDAAMSAGLGNRWSFIGPFETTDLNAPNGVRQWVENYGPLNQQLGESMTETVAWDGALLDEVEAAMREQLPIEDIPARQAWRDRRLMELAIHKQKQPKA